MSQEGYLQLKIRELNEKLQKSEDKINMLIETLNNKENEINELIKQLSVKIKEAEDSNKRKQRLYRIMKENEEEVKQFHKKNYSRVYKRLLNEMNRTLNEIKNLVIYQIADYTTHSFILEKYLQDKNLINPIAMLEYVDKYHDKIRDFSLKENALPLKSLKVEEVMKNIEND